MATCDVGHEPITFEGEFRILCPLCAALAAAAAAKAIAEYESESALENAQDDVSNAERRADKAEEELLALREKIRKEAQ